MSESRTFGPYTLLRRLAVGGMAEIHVAKTRGLGGFEKLVALKLVHPHLSADPHFVRMLIDEAKTVGMLAHVNVAQVFDLGCIDGTHFLAMEYVDGLDVHQLRGTAHDLGEQLPIAASCHIVSEMLNGLDYAHRKRDGAGRPLNLVHRDISPQNVMVSQGGEVKLVDFGIAKSSLQAEGTEVGVIKGKYYYMSPEQAWGDPADRRSDVFAAGLVLHEMLTGQMVYKGSSIPQLIARVREAQVPDPRSLRAEIPEPLAGVVMTALSRDPRSRFQSAIDMGEALRDVQYAFHPTFGAARLSEYVMHILEARARAAALAESRADNDSAVLASFGDPHATKRESLPERGDRRRNTGSIPVPRAKSSLPPPIPAAALRAREASVAASLAPPAGESIRPGDLKSWPLASAPDNDDPTLQWSALSASKLAAATWPQLAEAFDDGAPTSRHSALSPRAAQDSLARARASIAPSRGTAQTPALVPPPSGDVPIETIPPTPPLPDFQGHGRRTWLGWLVGACCAGLGALAYHSVVITPAEATLEIVTAPAGAEVRVDGRPQPSRTPVRLLGLVPDRGYAIALDAPGYKPWTGTMRVGRGSVKQIVVLKPLMGRVVVRSTPADAEVILNGANMGRTPLVLDELTITQPVTITLRRAGYRDVRRELRLREEQLESELDVQLTPLGGP